MRLTTPSVGPGLLCGAVVACAAWSAVPVLAAAASSPASPITEFTVPDDAGIGDLVVGPDRNLWFTEADQASLGRITTSGTVTSFRVAGAVTPAPDVVKVPSNPAGAGYHAPPQPLFGEPHGLTVGGDGDLWYAVRGSTLLGPGALGRMTPMGDATEWLVDAPEIARCGATSVLATGDGNIWYMVDGAGAVGTMDPRSTIAAQGGAAAARAAEYPVVVSSPNDYAGTVPISTNYDWEMCNQQSQVTRLRRGPDGQPWFGGTQTLLGGPPGAGGAGNVGWVTPAGAVTSYLLRPPPGFRDVTVTGVRVIDLTTAPDGTVWLTATWSTQPDDHPATDWYAIGHMFTGRYAGAVDWLYVTSTEGQPQNLVRGADGNVWFTDPQANAIGRITPCGVVDRYRIPTPQATPNEIVSGPDGNIWFTEPGNWFVRGVALPGSSGSRTGTSLSDFSNRIGRLSLAAVAPPGPCAHAVRFGAAAAGAADRGTATRDALTERRNHLW